MDRERLPTRTKERLARLELAQANRMKIRHQQESLLFTQFGQFTKTNLGLRACMASVGGVERGRSGNQKELA